MAKLKFVNKLSKDEINEILNNIGYELNEFVTNHEGEYLPSYEICDTFILCRCTLVDKKRIDEINKIEKVSEEVIGKYFSDSVNIYLSHLHKNFSNKNRDELFIINDFEIYPAFKAFFDEEEYEFNIKKLQNFLKEKFGEKYEIGYKLHLNKIARDMGYKNYNAYVKAILRKNKKSEKLNKENVAEKE